MPSFISVCSIHATIRALAAIVNTNCGALDALLCGNWSPVIDGNVVVVSAVAAGKGLLLAWVWFMRLTSAGWKQAIIGDPETIMAERV